MSNLKCLGGHHEKIQKCASVTTHFRINDCM